MLNKAMIIGRIGQDPEMRYLSNGDAVTNLSLATTETWKDKNGEKVQHTEWHKVTLYSKLAEIAGEYCKKGGLVYVEGKIKTRKWQDSNGQDRYTTEIQADTLRLLSSKESGGQEKPASGGSAKKAPTSVADMTDDIPFSRLSNRYDI